MRTSLLAAGIITEVLGGFLYALGAIFPQTVTNSTSAAQASSGTGSFPYISLPFLVGGLAMAVGGLILKEGPGPVRPPEGFRFCVYCSHPVKIGEERCSYCNGIQPKDVR